MGTVKTTQQAELERLVQREENQWALHKFDNLVQAVRKARELGWEQNKVQVRAERLDNTTSIYYIEPYEEGCGCRGKLKYEDFF